jgi:hypothetical protein
MSIGPGRPGEIEPPGHLFFCSAKDMKTHFVLPRPVFESPLKQAGSAHSVQGSKVGNHETCDAVFYSAVERANRRGAAGATN